MFRTHRKQAAKWIAGLAVFSLLALPGCAKKNPSPDAPEAVLTAQELLSRTGITMQIPPQARITQWLVSTDVNGNGFPQVNFVLDDISWSYGTQHTEQETPYRFISLSESVESESFEIAGVPCIAAQTESGIWAGWVENGVCHNLDSEDGSLEDAKIILHRILLLERPDLADADDFEEGFHIKGSYANQFKGIWKYDDADEWLYIWDNMTYTTAGADREPDERVRFCQMAEDSHDTMLLFNHTGGKIYRLTVGQEEEKLFLTDPQGRTLHPSKTAMNGTYYCYLGNWSLDGTTDMWLTKIMDLWLSSSHVNELVPGGVLHFEDVMISDIPLETVERKSDTWIVLNGTMDLKYDKTAQAWLLTGHDFLWLSWLGNSRMVSGTQIKDTLDKGKHTDLRKCFEAHEPVMGYVYVRQGVITYVEITDIFE